MVKATGLLLGGALVLAALSWWFGSTTSAPEPTAPAPSFPPQLQPAPGPATTASPLALLTQIPRDAQGNLLLDAMSQQLLEEALDREAARLDAAGLAQLQADLRAAVPGSGGEALASLAGNYLRYLAAKEAWQQLQPQQPEDPAQIRAQFEDLVLLREAQLGTAVSAQLFGEQDAAARIMLEAMLEAQREQEAAVPPASQAP